jgi:hypothetical protein
MPTTVTKTIGTGKDYTTFAACSAAMPNLVTADEIWHVQFSNEVHTGGISLTGITTDATRYIILDAEPGASFADHADKETNPQRYNASVGAAISGGVVISVPYTRIRRLQINGTGWGNWAFQISAVGCVVEDLIIEGTNSDRVIQIHSGGAGSFANVLGIQDFSTGQPGFVVQTTNAVYCDHVTMVRPSNKSGGGSGAWYGIGGVLRLRNCAGFGFGSFLQNTANTTGSSNNASDLAIGFGSDNEASITYADQFKVVTTASGTHDFRRKAGSALEGAGLNLAGTVDHDIIGRARAGPYDIGAWGSEESSPILGELIATLGDVGLSSSGSLLILGQTNTTLGSITLVSQSVLTIAGQASITLESLSLSSTGVLSIEGQGAVTLGSLTLDAQGVLDLSGSLSATLGNLTVVSAGSLALLGNVDATLAPLTVEATGTFFNFGSLNATLGELSLVAAGEVRDRVVELIRFPHPYAGRVHEIEDRNWLLSVSELPWEGRFLELDAHTTDRIAEIPA